jgi:4-oxalmesaconate hydratase
VKGIDPSSGHYFDDTKRYIDAASGLSAVDKAKIFEGNAFKVYARLKGAIARQAGGHVHG